MYIQKKTNLQRSLILVIQKIKRVIKTRISADWAERISKGDFILHFKKLSHFNYFAIKTHEYICKDHV